MKLIRIILSPILFFLGCVGSILLGVLPLLMGFVTVIGFSLQPTSIHLTIKEKKQNVKNSAFMMAVPFIFPFWVSWVWIQTGQIENL